MKTLALYSIKGGVGKTTAAVNFALAAAEDGLKTLLIDLDPQGASSFYFRVKPSEKLKSRWFLTAQDKLVKNIRASDYPNLDILPANLSYRHLDVMINQLDGGNKKVLKKVLKGLEPEYDLVVLDCPPSISVLSENVFQSADMILVPVIPTILSERTLEQLLEFVDDKKGLKEKVTPFLSMVNSRTRMHKDLTQRLREKHLPLLKGYIPMTAEIEKMGLHRAPVLAYARHSISARCYQMMWGEIRHRLMVMP